MPPTSCSGAACARGGRPLTVTEPLVGSSRPRIIRIVVDFPAPFGPRKPVTVPGRTVNVRSGTVTGFQIGRAHSELQSRFDLVCRLLLEKKKKKKKKKK